MLLALCAACSAAHSGVVVTPEAFGAKGDGVTNDTLAVRAAIDACSDANAAKYGAVQQLDMQSVDWCTVLFSAGKVYLTGAQAYERYIKDRWIDR